MEEGGNEPRDVVEGLKQQEERIIQLVTQLGLNVERSTKRAKGKTGKLVDAGDDQVDPFESGQVAFRKAVFTASLTCVSPAGTTQYH